MISEEIQYTLTAISQGNREAFKTLFLSYFPKVKYFIVHMVKDEFVAEDLAQDIFVKIWENRFRLAAIESFGPYLYQMARNAVINWYNKEAKFQFSILQPVTAVNDLPSVEDEYVAQELQLMINLIVNRMPERRKEIYRMSRVEGLKNEDIANQLNITKKTVEVQLNLALREIRKAIYMLPFFLL